MKKAFAILLTLALIGTLSVASFAATTVTDFSNDTAQDLSVSYTDMVLSTTKVYSVDIEWSATAFAYDAGTQGGWNAGNHSYGAAADADWTVDEITVTVTNHSNDDVNATLTVSDVAQGFTVTSDKDGAQDLASGEGLAYAEADDVVFTLTITGTPEDDVAKVATATIALAAGAAQ